MSNKTKSKDKIVIQYILDENHELQEIPLNECKTVKYPVRYRVENAFEVFVLVDGTENYWISNYGRCINNLHHKDKNTFYEHKQGNVHYTVHEIERYPEKNRRGRFTGRTCVDTIRRETTPAELVAGAFLTQYKKRTKVWHKDNNPANNWYKNLVMVTPNDYEMLKTGKVTWQELELVQGYIEYKNKARTAAYIIYNGIKARCSNAKNNRKCYEGAVMCQEWLSSPKSFIKWYFEHYYEVGRESMAVDKDLFGNGGKVYSPETCCILPQGLNTLLTNCKKHYEEAEDSNNTLPLGIRYNGKRKKYYGEINFTGNGNKTRLSEWDTAEQAFSEYKVMKQADIHMVASKYRESIPRYIYEALLKIDVKPY